jgi:hypothetical protein
MSGAIEETGAWDVPSAEGWQQYEFVVPEGDEAIDEIGISIEYFGRLKFLGRLFLADFEVSGAGHAVIEPKTETQEWGAISRFTFNRGHWTKDADRIHGHTAGDADMWTGHYYARDVVVTADVQRLSGISQLVTARVQGTGRFYAAGFEGDEVVITKEEFGSTALARAPFRVETGKSYQLALTAKGDRLSFAVDGKEVIAATDDAYQYGMAGIRIASAGRISVGRIEIVETA